MRGAPGLAVFETWAVRRHCSLNTLVFSRRFTCHSPIPATLAFPAPPPRLSSGNRLNSRRSFYPAATSKTVEGNLILNSSNVSQPAPNCLPIALTPPRFRDTLAPNESSSWLGRSSGRNPFHRSTTLSHIPMSDRSGWSARVHPAFGNVLLEHQGPRNPNPGNCAANGLLQHHGRLSSDPR